MAEIVIIFIWWLYLFGKKLTIGGGGMAKEAIEAIKAAEDKAKETVNDAIQVSKDTFLEAEKKADEEYKHIIDLAKTKAKEIKEKAVTDGEEAAKPIIEEGSIRTKALYQMNQEKLEGAVNIIIERVVNSNGDS